MSTTRKFQILSFESKILPDLFFAIVANEDKTRAVHETGMYPTRYWAKHAAREWAENSQSKKAKNLEPKRQ